tara:strand:- start:1658 stop:1972 length:315 start_codon:yes stop_codon:yes gene_type:complete
MPKVIDQKIQELMHESYADCCRKYGDNFSCSVMIEETAIKYYQYLLNKSLDEEFRSRIPVKFFRLRDVMEMLPSLPYFMKYLNNANEEKKSDACKYWDYVIIED